MAKVIKMDEALINWQEVDNVIKRCLKIGRKRWNK